MCLSGAVKYNCVQAQIYKSKSMFCVNNNGTLIYFQVDIYKIVERECFINGDLVKICIVNPLRLDGVFVSGIIWPLRVATLISLSAWDYFHLSGPPSSHSPSSLWPIRNIPNDQLAMFLCIHGN